MWHAARAEEKKVYSAMDMMRQRAERRREWIAKRSIDFTQLLRLTGVPCKMFHDTVQFEVQRSGGSLVPWRGHADNQVDRFDVRALLDYIPEYDNTHASARRRAQEEHELENLICFESYRALVEFARQGLSEEQALALVIDDLDNAPVVNMPVDVGPKNLPAGKGEYSHVGFAYEDGDGVVAAAPEEGDTGENVSDGAYEDLSPEREKEMDETAKAFGIHRYCSYRRFDLAEREEEKGRKRSEREKEDSRRGFTRKERRRVKLQKAKELAGANEWMIMKERGRESPSYDPYGSGRSRSRSPSPVLESTKEFITEIAVAPKEG